VDLNGDQIKTGRVILYQVPGIGGKAVFQVLDKPGGTETGDDLIPSQANPQEMVEPHKMVHVSMGNKKMRDSQNLSGLEARNLTQVEEKSPPVKADVDKEGRVPLRIIHQMGVKERIHVENIKDGPGKSQILGQIRVAKAGRF
jgi:hypothetical protein